MWPIIVSVERHKKKKIGGGDENKIGKYYFQIPESEIHGWEV